MSRPAKGSEWRLRERNTKLQSANTFLRNQIQECSRSKKIMAADTCRLRTVLRTIDEQGFELNRQGKVISAWATENAGTFRPPGFVIGKSIGAYFGAKALRDIRRVLTRVVVSGKAENLVHKQNRAGTQRWYNSRIAPMRSLAGRISNVCLFSRDITDSKLLEGRLAHAEKMESIGHLAGGICHDFNNILGVIRGTGELLSLNLGAAHPQQKYISQLLRSTDVAVALARQLQVFSREQATEPKAICFE